MEGLFNVGPLMPVMSEIVEESVLGLQESEEREGKARKLSDLLKEEEEESKEMDEIIERRRRRTRGKWRNFRERLGFKGAIGCCGGGCGRASSWGFSNATSDMTVREEGEDDEEEEEEDLQRVSVGQIPMTENSVDDDDGANRANSPNVGQIPVVSVDSRMNLATALAAERHIRAAHDMERDVPTEMIVASSTPLIRVSLMRLLEEGDGVDGKESGKGRRRREEEEGGSDWVCCVCMERRKGAAFIPCGHTFCRCCSRDLWLNRGSCPICNHSIVEILDIF